MAPTIDIHFHLAGTGTLLPQHRDELIRIIGEQRLRELCPTAFEGSTGCRLDTHGWLDMPEFFGRLVAKTDIADDFSFAELLIRFVRRSELVDKAVLLALDQVYELNGTPRPDATHLHVPNGWAAAVVAANPDAALFGASVHPSRRNACDELRRVAANGAVLIKWLPSAQDIQPDRQQYRQFYDELVRLGMPLLSHVGNEHTIPCAYSDKTAAQDNDSPMQSNNHPERLWFALECGVNVIAAHCALYERNDKPKGEGEDTPDNIDLLHEMMMKSPGGNGKGTLFSDLSAFITTSTFRTRLIDRIVGHFPDDRLLFGTDFPIIIPPLRPGAVAGRISAWESLNLMLTRNPLDRCVKTIQYLDFGPAVFTNARSVLRLHDVCSSNTT